MTSADPTYPAKSPANFLLLGASGMLGRAWRRLLEVRRISFDAPSRDELDLTSPARIEQFVTDRYTAVVNCAAWTDPDAAEQFEAEATQVNGQALVALAERCRRARALLVGFSCPEVFDGRDTQPYPANHAYDPINALGRSKCAGELEMIDAGGPHLLVRSSWLYAPWGDNFVRTVHEQALQGGIIEAPTDQRGRPTGCPHLASATLALIEKGATGIYHVTDGGECTLAQFAEEIVRYVNPACRVEPCFTASLNLPAIRPTYAVLDLVETEALLGPMPHWKKSLAGMLGKMKTCAA